ncbi:MAG: sigma factor-like helix-turn-helix DNA-binding protein [Pseudomonadota bacterium]
MIDSHPPLLPAIARGDIRAVRPLVDRYGPLVWSLLCRHLGGDAARHVSFQVFRELFDNAGALVREAVPEVVTVAAVTRRQLAANGSTATGTRVKAGSSTVADCVRQVPELVAVSRAMIALPNDQKRVVELAVLHGLSVDAIADQTGMAVTAVRRSLRQGLQVLRGEMSTGKAATSTEEGATL